MAVTWNPWHGCDKISPGCANCYVYRRDASVDKDSRVVTKNAAFDLPVRRTRSGAYKIPPGETVYTCFTSDFLLDKADAWREEAWAMMAERSDLRFLFITKRIDRLAACMPPGWERDFGHVCIGCTVENQDRADYRLPIFLSLPIARRVVICEPLLTAINLRPYLVAGEIAEVVVGGESGSAARPCDYRWVLDIRGQCMDAGVAFHFKQTGARFIKDGRLYRIARKFQHAQACRACIDYTPG